MSAERWLTPTDRRLLTALRRVPNLVRAARRVGIGRDRAVYRLQRMRRLYGAPVARGERGGPRAGSTRLTPLGLRLARAAASRSSRRVRQHWSGTYHVGSPASVDLGRGAHLEVAFRAKDRERVRVEIDPEMVFVARGRFESSARNVLPAEIVALVRRLSGRATLTALWRGRPVRVALTGASVDRLRLAPGIRVYLYLKAVAVRRAP